MNLNKVFLIGRLTADPEARTTPAGHMVCSLRMATNRVWNDPDTKERQEKTEYHTVVVWRRLAEIASQYLTKGSLVFIEGRIATRSWQDQEGNKRYRTEIIAESLQLGPKSATGGGQPATGGQPQESGSGKPKKSEKEDELPIIDEDVPPQEEEIDVKDIPF